MIRQARWVCLSTISDEISMLENGIIENGMIENGIVNCAFHEPGINSVYITFFFIDSLFAIYGPVITE